MIGLKRGTVKLVDHNPKWETAAAAAISQLKDIFGNTAKDIQHVGSTAIKNIKSKPIIDIAVAVEDFDLVTPLIPALENSGFHLRQHGVPNDMLFVVGDFKENILTHHVHVVKANNMEWINYINFRNYLNAHSSKAKEYEALKLRLLKQYPNNREAYTNAKGEFIRKILRKALVWAYLGHTVTVKIDRPKGTPHPKYPDMIYPVNYGYIPGVISNDGRPLDVYILGVDNPLEEFTGRVIGIINRQNDVEDKLVAAPEGMLLHQAQIEKAVHFQEQHYQISVDALYQKSCGAIIYRREKDKIEYLLLLQNRSRTWSFPKGHMEMNETEEETALREISEEVGITATLIPDFRQAVKYRTGLINREVVLFLAKATGKPVIREKEILEFRWVSAAKAKTLLYPEYGLLLDKVEVLLNE